MDQDDQAYRWPAPRETWTMAASLVFAWVAVAVLAISVVLPVLQ